MDPPDPLEPECWTKVAKNEFEKNYFLNLDRKMNAKRPIFKINIFEIMQGLFFVAGNPSSNFASFVGLVQSKNRK